MPRQLESLVCHRVPDVSMVVHGVWTSQRFRASPVQRHGLPCSWSVVRGQAKEARWEVEFPVQRWKCECGFSNLGWRSSCHDSGRVAQAVQGGSSGEAMGARVMTFSAAVKDVDRFSRQPGELHQVMLQESSLGRFGRCWRDWAVRSQVSRDPRTTRSWRKCSRKRKLCVVSWCGG